MFEEELERLYEQRQITNTHITSLLSLVDKLQNESAELTRRINGLHTNRRTIYRNTSENIQRNLYERNPRNDGNIRNERNPRNDGNIRNERNERNERLDENPEMDVPENPDSDLIFYFYLPRREETRELSPEIILRETKNTIFSEIETPNNLTCPISLEAFRPTQEVTIINHCGHIFNKEHLARWFETKTTCPNCRYNLNQPETPTLNRFANMASRMLGNALSSSVNDMLNDLQI